MSPSLLARLRDAAGATGRFFARLGLRGWATVVVLAAFPAAVPAALAVAYWVRPPGGTTGVLGREAPGAVQSLRAVPELAAIPGVLAVAFLVALFVHSAAETAFVRALRGGGPGWLSLPVGGRLFALRVALVAGVLGSVAALGAAVGVVLGDGAVAPADALLVAIPVYGPALGLLGGIALLVDAVTVDAVVAVVLADREPERGVAEPPLPEGEWGEAAWRRHRAEDAARATTGATGSGWSSSDRSRKRGVLAVWGRLRSVARRDPRTFGRFLAARAALELLVGVLTGLAFGVFLAVVGIAASFLGVLVVLGLDLAGAPALAAVAGFLLAIVLGAGVVVALTGLVHAPLRAYARYFGALAVGDLDPDLDALPERRRAIAVRNDERASPEGATDRRG